MIDVLNVLTATDIEALAWKAGLSMAEVCRRAGLAQSTFTRWKAGKTEPTLDAYRRLYRAVTPDSRMAASQQQADMHMLPEHSGPQPLSVREPATPFQFGSHAGGAASGSTKIDAETMEAADIFARIHRDLVVEEARADRLLRLYNR